MKGLLFLVIYCGACVSTATADLVRGIDIDFVTIGNPGNPGDTRIYAIPPGCGAVGYTYQIGKYEVTNAQWYDFVTAAGAPTGNPSDAYDDSAHFTGDNQPANEVSWYEAAQFSNYLTSGDKSQGAYQFSGNNANPGDFEGIDRDSALSTYGIVYVIPTEDEWYKAAYYGRRPNGSYGYSYYANGTYTAPIAGVDTNYDDTVGQPWDVGVGNGTKEQNGTYDIMGNVWEWNETLIVGSYRGVRGGTYADVGYVLRSSSRYYVTYPDYEYYHVGFRVASMKPTIRVMDFNKDGNVNFNDFSYLVAYFGDNEPSADIAPMPFGDGIVDFKDIAALLEHWLEDVLALAHWRLDETQGDIAYDDAGDKDGVIHGDPTWLPSGGQIDGALELDGIGDYVSTDFVLNPADGVFSVFAWVKGGAPGQVVISQTNELSIGPSWLAADLSGCLMTTVTPPGRVLLPLISEFVMTDGDWHHIGLIWDGSHRLLYADEAEVAKDAEARIGMVGATGGLHFGAAYDLEATSFFDGMIDDIRVYDEVVTP